MKAPFPARWWARGVACSLIVCGAVAPAQAQHASPAAAPASAPTDAAQGSAAEAARQAPRFGIYEFEVEGNTVLPVLAIERAVSPFMGEGRTVADVEAARAALEKTYQDAGYLSVFVDVPEQRVDEGVVQLKVLEGRVERLAVTGSRYYDQGVIRSRVPELAEGRVPNFNVVQAQLATVNTNELRRVQPVLRPGRDPGTVETELQVSDRLPVGGSIELNNHHAQFTKPLRLQASVRHDNLFQSDHSLVLTAITAPQDTAQSKVLVLNYTAPLVGGDAWMGFLVASDSAIEPLGVANVIGKGTSLGLHRIWNLPASPYLPGFFHNLALGVDVKDQKENTVAGNSGLATPMRYAPITAGYTANWLGEQGSRTQASVNLVANLRTTLKRRVLQSECGVADPGDPRDSVDQFECKRENADGGFALVKLDLRHVHKAWETAAGAWEAEWHLGGQLASQPLVAAEQYAIGGADTVRGYLEAEAIGDHGVLAGVELRGPNLARRDAPADAAGGGSVFDEITAYGFLEGGSIRLIGGDRQTLAGTGVGLKLRARKSLSANVDVAWPLKSTPAADGGHVTQAGQPRLHVRVGAEF
ncbi:MAG: ShlB/FhaC/HecB family hemolysin secretion/activation protein [Burkholderiales bacterium]|nr:ShlB/FhaC/HecB family hemolysin secretion/activation protein [Burkholderiales bacterium]